jgi:dolichol kinase
LYYYLISIIILAAVFLTEYYTHRHISIIGILAFIALSLIKYGMSYLSASLTAMLLLSFCLMYAYAVKRFAIFYIALGIIAVLFLICVHYGIATTYATMAFGIGALYGVASSGIESKKPKAQKQDVAIELRRDYLQILMGIVLVAVLGLMSISGFYLSFYLVLLGIFGIAFSANSKSKHLSVLRNLEKSGVFYGRGAIFLAIGFTILLSLYPDFKVALFGIAVLLFCDPIATIFGLRFGRSAKLPYNRKKSYAGTLSYFILGSVFGLLLVGYIGIPIALLLAIFESLGNKLDDNITIAIAYGVIGSLLA